MDPYDIHGNMAIVLSEWNLTPGEGYGSQSWPSKKGPCSPWHRLRHNSVRCPDCSCTIITWHASP